MLRLAGSVSPGLHRDEIVMRTDSIIYNKGEIMNITYKLDLSRYSVTDLHKMFLQLIISKQEMNDELDDRAEDHQMVMRKSLKVG